MRLVEKQLVFTDSAAMATAVQLLRVPWRLTASPLLIRASRLPVPALGGGAAYLCSFKGALLKVATNVEKARDRSRDRATRRKFGDGSDVAMTVVGW